MPSEAEQQTRKARVKYAKATIATSQYVVCVCGQLFYEPEPYADHVEQCEIDQRKAGAAMQLADLSTD